jgi:hypothetical protein
MSKKIKHTTSFNEAIDKKYGQKGKEKRNKWEQEFESFQLGYLIEEGGRIWWKVEDSVVK